MKFKNSQASNDAVILADSNGKIIHISAEAKSNLKGFKNGDLISKLVGSSDFNKILMNNRTIDIVTTVVDEYNLAVIKVNSGIAKTFEIHLFKNLDYSTENFTNDKVLFSSYNSVANSKSGKTIVIGEFLDKLSSTVKEDLRFAYKKFEILPLSVESSELYVNYMHLCAMAVGAISILNDVDYKAPIILNIEECFGKYIFNLSVETEYTGKNAKGISAFSNVFPTAATRLSYLLSLSADSGVDCEFEIEPRKVSVSFDISRMTSSSGSLEYSRVDADYSGYIKEAMKIFFTDTGAEEQ